MHLVVSFKNLRPREEMRRRAQALFAKLEKFLDPASEGTLVLWTEHGRCIAELTVSRPGATHQVQEEDQELRPALDRAFHRMESALRRGKERRVDRWHAGGGDLDGFDLADGEVVDDPPTFVPAPPVAK